MNAVQQDPYIVLGVAPRATAKEIKDAYRALAKLYHPDVNPGDSNAEHRFKRATAAYSILGDAAKRREYDGARDRALHDVGSSAFGDHYRRSRHRSSHHGAASVSPGQQARESHDDLRALADILADTRAFIRRYVVLSDDQARIITLWVAHTHAIKAFDCTPYLQVTSATAEAGKTRLLEVLEHLVCRPWLTQRTSAAVVVRKIDAESPTLLLDETDAAFNGDQEYSETLRGLLNSGYRRSGKASVCVGQGANISYRDFSTFGAKALSGIGRLPDTLASRAIRIALQRRGQQEHVEKFRERDATIEAGPIRVALATWAKDAIPSLQAARPTMPAGLRDRAEDVLEPLLAIADLAGREWAEAARKAAVTLMGSVADQDVNIEMLQDFHVVFADNPNITFVSSTELIKKLCEQEGRPWADWKHGKPITTRAIADRLKAFGIVPKRNEAGTIRGYDRTQFEDAWERYLPSLSADPRVKPSNRQTPNKSAPESAFSKRQAKSASDTSETQKSSINPASADGLTSRSPGTSETDNVRDF
jgi:hypothetical protein